jgi:hypothetical protein
MSKKQPQKNQPPEAHDPDSWLRKLHTPDNIKAWLQTEKDYISDYMVTKCMAAATGPAGVAVQVKVMAELIEAIPDDIVRNCYYDDVGKVWGAFRKNYKLKKREDVSLPKLEKLKKEDKSAFFDFGFWEKEGAYYTYEHGKEVRICNFSINILYFVRSENLPKYVCIFTSIFGRSRITSITTDDFTSVGTFKKVVGRLNLVFEGNDSQLNKIKLKLFHGVREAEEPKFMGYNAAGNFYTWANGLYYNKQFYKTDKYGMVELKHPIETMDQFKNLPPESHVIFGEDLHVLENSEVFIEKNSEEKVAMYIEQKQAMHLSFYFLPFSSRLKVTDHDDDDFEFERKFKHTIPNEKSTPLTFEKWASLMYRAYGTNGCAAIAYYCMSLFRDIVFRHNNNYVPLLGFFGPRQSGKSTCARSLNKMWGEGLEDGVNLESGSTATGVRRYLASMQNAMLWLNEYKNSLPDYTLGMIKGIADGSGKLTGRNTGGNETKTYKPRCTAVVCGQDVPTKDPAILSRMIVCEFDGKGRDREAWLELTSLEKEGKCSAVTLEVLDYRDEIKEYFSRMEPDSARIFRDSIKTDLKQDAEDRIVLNNSSLLAVFSILNQSGLKFPFSEEELVNFLLSKIDVQISIQQTSDDVEQYFNVLQSCMDKGEIREDEHYKITKDSSGKKKFYLRVRPINTTYMAAAQRAGMAAMTLGTVTQYLKKHKSFLEHKLENVNFEKLSNRTSAFVFDYDKLLAQGIEFKLNREPLLDI